jgi:NADH:ubiquinone oxidoreductase subunit F (NADH-binding)/NADH:ubiquinone oxidoreductase subunit E
MSLIHELERLQEDRGFLSEDTLRELAHASKTPLYRLQELISFYPHFRTSPPSPITVHVCRDMSCHLAGGDGLTERLREALDRDDVEVEEVSCLGCCELAPAVRVNGAPVHVGDPGDLSDALSNGGRPAVDAGPREWACDPYDGDPERAYECFRQTLAQIGRDGAVDALIGALKDAGLRGMGGAGFPTGRKWELVRAETAAPKYVVCNADESEPGTFKDRVVMEQLPWLVIEGMLVAGLAIGAERGIVYLRHEYHAARAAIERELARARDQGWLGNEILGSDFAFDIEVFISPGGYILGEETALLEALEDKRGEPRNKPPFPGQKGLWGQPTLMNNVETFAYVPIIGLKGAGWWHEQGKRGCKGLKCIAVSGHVEDPGVYEIPLGTTVAELIELAGGVSEGRALKGFAPGGASSNFLPASKADTPIDFGTLADAGSMMGSGALVVFAEGTPVLPLATNVVRFFRNESCGKCVPCRDGTEKAVRMLDAALEDGAAVDWSAIDRLQLLLEETSICGLGYVALNPLLSAAEHWPEEVPGAASTSAGGASS